MLTLWNFHRRRHADPVDSTNAGCLAGLPHSTAPTDYLLLVNRGQAYPSYFSRHPRLPNRLRGSRTNVYVRGRSEIRSSRSILRAWTGKFERRTYPCGEQSRSMGAYIAYRLQGQRLCVPGIQHR